MPMKPKKPCSYPGCSNLTNERHCIEHMRMVARQYDERRGSSTARGYGWGWQRYRKMYIAKNPLCRQCERQGRLTPAEVVDHIEPVEGPNDPRFWDPTNHQPLCDPCHNVKRATEDKETWKKRRG